MDYPIALFASTVVICLTVVCGRLITANLELNRQVARLASDEANKKYLRGEL
jgi:hypothetical protein